jgi:hypothetical protein
MRTAVLILLVCSAADLVACGLLLAVVWAEHRRQRRAALAAGHPPPPSAAGQFLFLGAVGAAGFVALYGTAWLLLRG